jgi:hypothetical protein
MIHDLLWPTAQKIHAGISKAFGLPLGKTLR